MKARDVMTGSVVTCHPDAPVAEAARLMRDRNTGDVLVARDGKLMGIVTDRDIAVRVAADELDPSQVPIRHFMSKHLMTGEPNWDLNKIANVMGKKQIRRLPIVDHGMLVGIVSLGDIALRNQSKSDIVKSLKHISEPRSVHTSHGGGGRVMAMLGLGLLAGAIIYLTLSPKTFSSLWEQIQDSDLRDRILDSDLAGKVMDTFEEGRDRLTKLAA